MLGTVRLYIDAALAVAIMAALGIIAGFLAAGLSGDRTFAFLAAGAVFVLTGGVLIVRLWRMTQTPALPHEPGV